MDSECAEPAGVQNPGLNTSSGAGHRRPRFESEECVSTYLLFRENLGRHDHKSNHRLLVLLRIEQRRAYNERFAHAGTDDEEEILLVHEVAAVGELEVLRFTYTAFCAEEGVYFFSRGDRGVGHVVKGVGFDYITVWYNEDFVRIEEKSATRRWRLSSEPRGRLISDSELKCRGYSRTLISRVLHLASSSPSYALEAAFGSRYNHTSLKCHLLCCALGTVDEDSASSLLLELMNARRAWPIPRSTLQHMSRMILPDTGKPPSSASFTLQVSF